jgi:hypothetical protein
MAAVAATKQVGPLPIGDKYLVTVRTSALGTGAVDEYIAASSIGLSWIDAIVGAVIIDDDVVTAPAQCAKNSRGSTISGEGSYPGDLGIEVTDAATNIVEITVIGKV